MTTPVPPSPTPAGDPVQRQQLILQAAAQAGRVGVDSLAQALGVTPQTIRRDLKELTRRGLLQRIHGGAVLANSASNLSYEARRAQAAEGKRWIGERAAALIPDNCSLLINIGTTTEQVARALKGRRDLLIITNNINVVNILIGSPGIELVIAGGLVRQSDGGIVGEAAIDFISQFKVDYAVIGTSAIDGDGALLDYDLREVKVAQAILRNARKAMLVADAMKYERSAPVRLGALTAIDIFVTDRRPPDGILALCQSAKVQVEHPPVQSP